jgi:GNAT superfamily N-acetyltransferase
VTTDAVDEDRPVARVAGPEDLDRVVEILVGAFENDPTWSWAFPDPTQRPLQYRRLWRLFVEGAARYPSVWLNADETATAVWIPPGGTEMSPEQEAQIEPLIRELVGAEDAPRVQRTVDAFGEAHPRDTDHYYLTLLGTDPAHLGKGLGLQLLEDTLRLADDDGMPAYLEASNPVNVALYARYGFRPYATVALPQGVADVTTMWRDPRPPR